MSALTTLVQGRRFAHEAEPSTCGYCAGYVQPVSIAEQVSLLQELFSGVGCANEELVERSLPFGAEGYFAIPRWEKFAPTYGEAVQRVFQMIERTRGKFHNSREGKLGSRYLRQHSKTIAAFQTLGASQKGYDILVVPAQLGVGYHGYSGRSALEAMGPFEFGLGVFAVGIMLLTHPNRLQHPHDLIIDLPGDESSQDGNDLFGSAPYLSFGFGTVCTNNKELDYFSKVFGSASGFVPQ